MTDFELLPAHKQKQITGEPYDKWVRPDGEDTALFYRQPHGYLVRFPQQADFQISVPGLCVKCVPAPEASSEVAENLYYNSIVPLIGNHSGSLVLHGSAVELGGKAVAFLGASRRGKTTLAGAFAHAGHPFLTEDMIALELQEGGYLVRPSRPVLRLFDDSAEHLLGLESGAPDEYEKRSVAATDTLPFADKPLSLERIYFLGPGDAKTTSIHNLSEAAALTELFQHAFILDVEDRRRLREHFERLGALARTVRCAALDYPRNYKHLPSVIEGVARHAEANGYQDATG